ncbi:Uncharacterised protein [Legionella wadsworthii]|uniref:Uncharacterized protein n=1 Tax=Legionella wadsworthii TaxID=28088 RepID=A0A378LR31_9GAMM|nr:hypothetical protein [Legionella wadsworthii]STY28269.1 Uncharacterised protein [Legionella wadsworthii]
MKSKSDIEKELKDAQKRLQELETEVKDNNDRGVDRYMFLTSISQLLDGASRKVQSLEAELDKFKEKNISPAMGS